MAEAAAVLEPTRSGVEGRPLGGQVEQARRETRYAMDKLKDSMVEKTKDLGGYCISLGPSAWTSKAEDEEQAVILTTPIEHRSMEEHQNSRQYIFATSEGFKQVLCQYPPTQQEKSFRDFLDDVSTGKERPEVHNRSGLGYRKSRMIRGGHGGSISWGSDNGTGHIYKIEEDGLKIRITDVRPEDVQNALQLSIKEAAPSLERQIWYERSTQQTAANVLNTINSAPPKV